MKSKAMAVAAVLAAVLTWGGCREQVSERDGSPSPPATQPAGQGEIAAYVDGVPISAAELDASAKGQIQNLLTQIYQVKKNVLEGMIADRLIEKAAGEQGVSVEEYVTEHADAKVEPPTDEEIRAFYEQQKGRMNAPFDQMRERIAEDLKNVRRNEKRQALVAGLRGQADVRILLDPPRTEIPLDDAAYTIGARDAKIVLVEFTDYQCPYSKRAQPTVRRVLDDYRGKVLYAFFDYPLSFHPDAMKAHEAARCAGEQGKYVQYSAKIFQNQTSLGVEDLKRYAQEIRLDTKAFDSCLDGGQASARVQKSVEAGNRAGVSGTPAFFVNGIMISGAQPFESFQEIVKAELSR